MLAGAASIVHTDRRLAEMQQRRQPLTRAVDLVEPPLTRIYDALNDEQKPASMP